MGPHRKTTLHEVSARRRFPVHHLASDEQAGKPSDHESVIDFRPTHSTRRRNGFSQRTRPLERDDALLHGARQRNGVVPGPVRQEGVRRVTDAPPREGLVKKITSRRLHLRNQLLDTEGWLEVDGYGGFRHRTQCGTELVNRAAFEPIARDKQLPDGQRVTGANMDVLQRLAFDTRQNLRRPIAFPTTVGRSQRMHRETERR